MDWNTLFTALIGILGGGGGLLALIKAGLLKISIGKNGNGKDASLKELILNMENNHLHTLQTTLNETRKDQNERLDRMINLLEEAQKSHIETLLILRRLDK